MPKDFGRKLQLLGPALGNSVQRSTGGWGFFSPSWMTLLVLLALLAFDAACSRDSGTGDQEQNLALFVFTAQPVGGCAVYPTRSRVTESGVSYDRTCAFIPADRAYRCSLDGAHSVTYTYVTLQRFIDKFTMAPGIVGLTKKETNSNVYSYSYASADAAGRRMLAYREVTGAYGERYSQWDDLDRPTAGQVSDGPCAGRSITYEYHDIVRIWRSYSITIAAEDAACFARSDLHYDRHLNLVRKTTVTSNATTDDAFDVIEREVLCP